MKKVFFAIIFFVVCIGIGTFIGGMISHQNTKVPQQVVEGTAQHITATPTITVTPTPGIPQRIVIPKIHVDAVIESVAKDNEGRMDIPKIAKDTAWYDLGFRPGEKGSAVIDGHYDMVTGAPAVFYDIAKLTPGDKIFVTDTTGKQYIFAVDQTTSYAFDNLPLQTIFSSTDKARLNLITCIGTWDKVKKNYSNREVVYSELIQ